MLTYRLKLGKNTYGQNNTQIVSDDVFLIEDFKDRTFGYIFNELNELYSEIENIDLNSRVPYTGANQDVDLGNHTLELGKEEIINDVGRFRNLLMSADSNSSLLRTQHRTKNSPTSNSFSVTDNVGLGVLALQENIGGDVVAIGRSAAEFNKGGRSNAIGAYSLYLNEGTNCNGLGAYSLRNNLGKRCEGVGYEALFGNTGDDVIGIGIFSGRSNTGNDVILLGNDSGRNNTGNNSIGIGADTLKDNQQNDNIAIGHNSFNTLNTTITNTVALGVNSQPTESNQIMLGNSQTEQVVTQRDYVSNEPGKGVILTTPDGSRQYRISVNNLGVIQTTLI